MTIALDVSRRGFLAGSAAAGTGLSLDFPTEVAAQGAAATAAPEVNAWVVIRPDDTIVVRVARSEMGQGTLTGLAQLVVEELEGDWSKVTTESITAAQNLARNRVWGEMGTGGSRGIRISQDYVRRGGAAARLMLLQAAADAWKVPGAEVSVSKGVVTHAASGRSTSYGKLADAASRLTPPDPKDIKLKDPKDWTIAGKPLARLDTADKLTGSKVYAIDVRLAGMLNAAIKHCPVYGGKLDRYDEAKVASMPGVRAVQFIISMQACARNGVPYTASTVFAAPAMAFSASPFERSPLVTAAVKPSRRCSAIVTSDAAAPGPSFQTIGSASSAVFARHQVSATTATAESETFTTARTPGIDATLPSS